MPRIHRVEPTSAGWTRRKHGRGFAYLDASDRPIDDAAAVARIRSLAIPPAWTDVWICPDSWGHIQATGVDSAGRRQYLYHPRWRHWRDRLKFRRMHDFARVLPAVRETLAGHLELPGLPREKALATAVRLLDRGYFRIGSEAYAERNGSYGLATLRKEHVRIDDDGVRFDFTAKGGKRRVMLVRDGQIERVLRELKARRSGGPELLAYRDGDAWRDVRSSDVNEYLREITGGRFTAKDFRTWHATVLAAVALAARGDVRPSSSARRRAMSAAVKEVAEFLGNTPTVCRQSYIDPRVLDRYFEGATIASTLDALPRGGVGDSRSERERASGSPPRGGVGDSRSERERASGSPPRGGVGDSRSERERASGSPQEKALGLDVIDTGVQAQIEEAVLDLVAGRIEPTPYEVAPRRKDAA